MSPTRPGASTQVWRNSNHGRHFRDIRHRTEFKYLWS
ncbi:MAG TPA: hypothetical protein DCY25_13305 [Bacteroidales bacterium]|nr:hypothetical protein [Bacteroidales bacterium]